MKQEYHYTISRTDRICLIIFVTALLGWELIKNVLPAGKKSFVYLASPAEEESEENYNSNEYLKKYPNQYSRKYNYPKRSSFKNYNDSKYEAIIPPPLSPLPVMTASIDELLSMGFSKKVAYNIQKYVASGGMLTRAEDLMKIYGMDSMQLDKAKDFIIYASVDQGTKDQRPTTNDQSKWEFAKINYQSIIDLNLATVGELESLNGIGSVLAERIIKFRESLGGFIDREQLKDCYGITPELYDQLKPQLSASGSPKVILINEVDLTMLSHPYLNKKFVKLIKAYKEHHGPFMNADELRKVYPPDTGWCRKVLPYISFEIREDNFKQ